MYGVTKATYPYLQATNIDGSSITAANLLENIFLAYAAVRSKARGNANKIVMSFKNFGTCMIQLEVQKGSYKVMPGTTKATSYGWSEIQVMSVTGELLTIIGVQECNDSEIYFLDMSSMKFFTNGGFKKRVAPDGKEFYETRDGTNGYSYIVDIRVFGEFVVNKPGVNGVIFGISY